jgi:hypothetical protein
MFKNARSSAVGYLNLDDECAARFDRLDVTLASSSNHVSARFVCKVSDRVIRGETVAKRE